jgi:3-hydroxy-3-methylglutaryl CoA synthase
MPQLAQIQAAQYDLVALIDESITLTAEKKDFWRVRVQFMTREEQGKLLQLLLAEKEAVDQAYAERDQKIVNAATTFMHNVYSETQKTEKHLWKVAASIVRDQDAQKAEEGLQGLSDI